MHARFICQMVFCTMLVFSTSITSAASWPVIEFDAPDVVACRDITPDTWQDGASTDRLIEASFSISSLLRRGSDQQVIHFLYRIESPDRSLSVVDYLPKTELATSVVGKVAVEKQREGSFSIGANVSGKYDRRASGTVSGSKGESNKSSVRYELLPPKELVAAAGTISRHHGVYFKLKPSKRTSLEGAKQFICVFRVPRDWRGARIRIRCEATVKNPHGTIALPGGETIVGSADFASGLFLKDDTEARRVISELVAATRQLRIVRRAIEAKRAKDYAGQFNRAMAEVAEFVAPVRPDRLLRKITGKKKTVTAHKPIDPRPLVLRRAVARREEAERQLTKINGNS